MVYPDMESRVLENRDLSINENDFCCYFTMETYRVRVMYDLGPEP